MFEKYHAMSLTVKPACPDCGGEGCEKLVTTFGIHYPQREIWQYDDIHKVKPKWLKSRDGKTRVRYDPTRHGSPKSQP